MNSTAIILLVIVVVLVIAAVIAWLLVKSGFTVKEMTAKLPFFEVKADRDPIAATPPQPAASAPPAPPRTEASQDALRGGQIKDSNIKAPADAGARLRQKAEGKDSRITGSDIELK